MSERIYDLEKIFLGVLCPNGHEHKKTGKSIRYKNSHRACVQCVGEQQKRYYKKKPEIVKKCAKDWVKKNRKRYNELARIGYHRRKLEKEK